MQKNYFDGTRTFSVGLTSFGYYDNDVKFQSHADKVAQWVARQLGYPILDVELANEQLYDAFESAITVYSREVYNFKLRDNFGFLDGTQVPNDPNFNIANVRVTPNLGALIRISKQYGAESMSGGNVTLYSGSIAIKSRQQVYDLKQWAVTSGSMRPDEEIEIKHIFYENRPAVTRYIDPTMGGALGLSNFLESVGYGESFVGANYLMMPIDFDLLRIQAIEFNDAIRRSAYSFQLINNELRIFPLPTRDGVISFNYIKVAERDASFNPNYLISGSTISTNISTSTITNISNVPYGNMTYSQITNASDIDWIMNMTLAISMRMLGMVRGKTSQIPLANGEGIQLNQSDLFTQGQAIEQNLLQQLRDTLDATSRSKQLEKQSQEKNYMQDTLGGIALPFYIM